MPEENLHRKNAAEWVMFVVIYPFAWVAGLLVRWRGRSDGEQG